MNMTGFIPPRFFAGPGRNTFKHSDIFLLNRHITDILNVMQLLRPTAINYALHGGTGDTSEQCASLGCWKSRRRLCAFCEI